MAPCRIWESVAEPFQPDKMKMKSPFVSHTPRTFVAFTLPCSISRSITCGHVHFYVRVVKDTHAILQRIIKRPNTIIWENQDSICIMKPNSWHLNSKHRHLGSVQSLGTSCGFANNSSDRRNTTIRTTLKCLDTVSSERTKSHCISRFLTSCASTCRKIATISSTSITSVDSNTVVVRRRWQRIVKQRLSMCVLYWHTRSDSWIIRKYAIYLILCLVLHGTWGILLLSLKNVSNVIIIWRWASRKAFKRFASFVGFIGRYAKGHPDKDFR